MLAMLPAVKRCFMNLWVGIALTIVAAIMNGNFTVPLKRTRQRPWENSWALYSLVAFWVIPWGLAGFTNPHLLETFNSLFLRARRSQSWPLRGPLESLGTEKKGEKGEKAFQWRPLVVR
jgi:hypothetical protein